MNRFLIRTDVAMYHRRGHRCRTPRFVAKITLTYKAEIPILPPTKRKFLSNIWQATVLALNRVDTVMMKMQGGNVYLQDLKDIMGSQSALSSPYDNIILLGVICCWIVAVVDAYISGKRKDLQEAVTSKS